MNNDEIYLSKMLRGENMGINIYEKYLKKLPEGDYKREVEKFRQEHIRHKTRLENIMVSKEIEVSSEIGIQGKMSEIMTSVKLMFKNEPKAVLKDIRKGELMAAKYSEMYLSEFSESIRPDIEKILNEDRERISKLNKLLKTP
jgi:rubrerythrin